MLDPGVTYQSGMMNALAGGRPDGRDQLNGGARAPRVRLPAHDDKGASVPIGPIAQPTNPAVAALSGLQPMPPQFFPPGLGSNFWVNGMRPGATPFDLPTY